MTIRYLQFNFGDKNDFTDFNEWMSTSPLLQRQGLAHEPWAKLRQFESKRLENRIVSERERERERGIKGEEEERDLPDAEGL